MFSKRCSIRRKNSRYSIILRRCLYRYYTYVAPNTKLNRVEKKMKRQAHVAIQFGYCFPAKKGKRLFDHIFIYFKDIKTEDLSTNFLNNYVVPWSSKFPVPKEVLSCFLDNPVCNDALLRLLIDCRRFTLAWNEVPSTIDILEYCLSSSLGFRSVNMQIK